MQWQCGDGLAYLACHVRPSKPRRPACRTRDISASRKQQLASIKQQFCFMIYFRCSCTSDHQMLWNSTTSDKSKWMVSSGSTFSPSHSSRGAIDCSRETPKAAPQSLISAEDFWRPGEKFAGIVRYLRFHYYGFSHRPRHWRWSANKGASAHQLGLLGFSQSLDTVISCRPAPPLATMTSALKLEQHLNHDAVSPHRHPNLTTGTPQKDRQSRPAGPEAQFSDLMT